ncbi:uncharacterized protein TNCV_1956791 [Trichonephila clavipes]|nr:uncharacterized protein TNCV_1956791 [Trichonephila clavipes]
MFDPSSFDNPTPLAHADFSRDVLPRGGTSQLLPTRFNLYEADMRNARGFNVWTEGYFSGSENVTEFSEEKTEPGADRFCLRFVKITKEIRTEKALADHIFVRLEPQVQDYVEVRNPQNTIQLLEVLAKFEERYSCKATRGSRNSDNVEGRG